MGCPISKQSGISKGDRVGDAAHPSTVLSVYSNGQAKCRGDDGHIWWTEARFLRLLNPPPAAAASAPVLGTAIELQDGSQVIGVPLGGGSAVVAEAMPVPTQSL
jgi:hypothetical protein